ncbi:hypothetical protein QUA13_27635, partial [Microcoleus sp. S28C3]|uniref:hypothetical protein n=1 Tax=Microcoleus sp. S28C3 TaxID=3055414 RepID=UPI002FD4FAC0
FKSGSFSIPRSNVYLVFLSRGLSNYDNFNHHPGIPDMAADVAAQPLLTPNYIFLKEPRRR